jgi:hypothetical protein
VENNEGLVPNRFRSGVDAGDALIKKQAEVFAA